MKIQTMIYCRPCSEPVLKAWRGWPERDAVPFLPQIINGSCEKCNRNSSDGIESTKLRLGPYYKKFESIGLPDAFEVYESNHDSHGIPNFGYPYFTVGECPNCSKPTQVSFWRFPNGKVEIIHNCLICGRVRDGQSEPVTPRISDLSPWTNEAVTAALAALEKVSPGAMLTPAQMREILSAAKDAHSVAIFAADKPEPLTNEDVARPGNWRRGEKGPWRFVRQRRA